MTGRILGPDGRPLSAEAELNLQLLIDTAVEAKVNTAVDHLRADLRTDQRRESVLTWVRYGALLVINAILGVTLYFIGPDIVRDWTRQFVADNMNRPILQQAADELMRSRMENYINDALARVETGVKDVTQSLSSLRDQQAGVAKLAEDLSAKTDAAERKLRDVDTSLTSAGGKLQELDKIAEFTRTVVAAQNDDRLAFDKLEAWANDATFPMRQEALASYATVLDQHAQSMYASGFTVPWKEGVDPAKLSLVDLQRTYDAAPGWLKPGLIEYAWSREDIPRKDRMAFLADVVARDRSLKAVEYAGRILSAALDAKLKPLAIKPLLDAWKEKQSSVQ